MATATTGPEKLHSYNPATGEANGSVPIFTPAEVDAAVLRARLAAPSWSQPSVRARIEELAAGNAVVWKPSELTPLVALEIEKLAKQAFALPDLLQVVTGAGTTGAALARAAVDKIAFTGSAATGKRVMTAASERLTPVLLELGGKDAMIVEADADLDKAAEACVYGALTNAGQAC